MNDAMILPTLSSINQALSKIALNLSSSLQIVRSSDYPNAATAITGSSGNVAAATATATLPAVTTQINYLTGFDVTSSGSTGAQVVTIQVNGVIGGTMSFIYTSVAGVTTANAPLSIRFPNPIPSILNTAITVTVPSLGAGNTNAAVTAYGYVI